MADPLHYRYLVFVMCGRDARRRRLMEAVDPEEKYKSKALLPFLGKQLVEWQLEALRKSPYVGELYLLGLNEGDLTLPYPVHFVPVETTADFSDKLIHGLAALEARGETPDRVVISSCDAPGIRVREINAFFEALEANGDAAFLLSLVPEDVIEAEFPGSGRVVVRFRDCQVFPGELYALSPRVIRGQHDLIREFTLRRRQINRQARKIGLGPFLRYIARKPRVWGLLARYALGLATLADAERVLSAAFGVPSKGVLIPDAGFGMDMDLPEDYARLEDFVRRTKLGGEQG